MTDTARTLAEVKNLLASNVTRDISAQDLRDVAESIANPVPGGGFDWNATNNVLDIDDGGSPMNLYRWNGGAFTPVTTITASDFYIPRNLHAANANFYDPGGWINPSTVDGGSYWSGTFPANSTIKPGRGLYLWSVNTYLQNDPVADKEYYVQLDFAEPPTDGSALKASYPITYFTKDFPNDLGVNPKGSLNSGAIVIDADEDSVVPYIFVPAGGTNGGGLTDFTLQMVRVTR